MRLEPAGATAKKDDSVKKTGLNDKKTSLSQRIGKIFGR